MVYLPELLVVMTDGLKIVRIRARNVLRIDGQKRLDDDASLTQESDGLVCSRSIYNLWLWCARCAGAPSCWNTKKSYPDNMCTSGSGLYARKLSRQYALFTLAPNL